MTPVHHQYQLARRHADTHPACFKRAATRLLNQMGFTLQISPGIWLYQGTQP